MRPAVRKEVSLSISDSTLATTAGVAAFISTVGTTLVVLVLFDTALPFSKGVTIFKAGRAAITYNLRY